MPQTKIIALAAVIVVFLALALAFLSSPAEKRKQGQAQTAESSGPVLTIGGKVTEVRADKRFFLFQDQASGEIHKVVIGDETKFTQLVVPGGIQEGSSFVFEKQDIALEDVEAGREGFVSSSHEIGAREDIVHPKEVRLLPR